VEPQASNFIFWSNTWTQLEEYVSC